MRVLSLAGLRVLLGLSVLLTGVGGAADAFNLPVSTVRGIAQPVTGRAVQGCPTLVAGELHIVRIIPQKTRRGELAYRYVLNGIIQNRGLAGIAVAGINVAQKKGRGPARRIALKLFKRRVQPNQRLDISGDLHLQIQSNPILPTDNPFPSFTLNVTNLRNDSGQCADARGTAVYISSNAVRSALPARARGGSQAAGSLHKTKKMLNWQQPVTSSSKVRTSGVKRGTATVITPSPSAAAVNARRIGEDAARARQIQQMQKTRELGSPMDQARRGPTGRQDCRHSPNPAECLQNDLATGQGSGGLPNGGNGRSTQACLQAGGSPADCVAGGGNRRRGGVGRLQPGPPGDPRGRLKDPRGMASTTADDESLSAEDNRTHGPPAANSGSGWSPWRATDRHDGVTGKERQRTVNGQTQVERRQYNSRTGETLVTVGVVDKRDNYSMTHSVTYDRNGDVIQRRTSGMDNGRVTSDYVTDITHRNLTPQSGGAAGPTGQVAPEGSNGPANDNCDWNPALGKCMKSPADPQGMTSQPGPDGENPGENPGGSTPHIGSEAVTNGGGGDWNTGDRRGFGFGNGGKPLDMKDPGGVAPK